MNQIKDRWKYFGQAIFDPWSILLTVGTILLLIVLFKQSDKTIIIILTFIISLSSGVLGGILGKRWEDLTEERVIVARGKSAIRDLKLLLGCVASLESRVRQYLEKYKSENQKKSTAQAVIEINFEEVVERCNTIEEQVINSIETWMDVIPEANLSTQIGIITELKEKGITLEVALDTLNHELFETKNKTQEEINKLTEEKHQKEKELQETKQELRDKAYTLGSTISGSSLLADSYVRTSPFTISLPKVCSKCGRTFTEDPLAIPVGLDLNLCPSCRRSLTINVK